jgi:hypothetical protein
VVLYPGAGTGVVLGWVPLEEYTFFVVETILAGLWLLFLARRLFFAPDTAPLRTRFCVFAPLLLVPTGGLPSRSLR